jgi:hypothetical protein
VCRLGAIDPAAVFRLNAREIQGLMPPGIHVGGGEPSLKQRKVGSAKRPE